MPESIPKDLITVREAKQLLGIGTKKMAQLLRDNVIRFYEDPLDARVKLVSETYVRALIVRRKAA